MVGDAGGKVKKGHFMKLSECMPLHLVIILGIMGSPVMDFNNGSCFSDYNLFIFEETQ